LIEPKSFPPLDSFNYTSYCFIRAPADDVELKVPQNFSYAPLGEQNDYHKFKSWFIDCVTSYQGQDYKVIDIVNFDKALMSFGSFLQKVWETI